MKIPTLFHKKKKLQAATRAVPRRVMEESDEPSMRLSSAFIVVLLLHLVAVGGIYAFNSIKTHQGAYATSPPPPVATPAAASGVTPGTAVAKTEVAPVANPVTQKTAPKTADHKPVMQDSGQVYTVVKGDNPVTIAKRQHVSYDELLKLNKIDDPKKLQIGQKLHLPPKTK